MRSEVRGAGAASAALVPTEEELLRRPAWRKQGIVVIRLADVREEIMRRALLNEATRLYGRREVA